jgi:hypothetical protein
MDTAKWNLRSRGRLSAKEEGIGVYPIGNLSVHVLICSLGIAAPVFFSSGLFWVLDVV